MDVRLKSKILIDRIFKDGKSDFKYPLKVCYLKEQKDSDNIHFKYGVSVSKRYYKRAVDRNKIKRLLRESIRSFKFERQNLDHVTTYYIMFIYVGKEILDFQTLEKAVHKSLLKLLK